MLIGPGTIRVRSRSSSQRDLVYISSVEKLYFNPHLLQMLSALKRKLSPKSLSRSPRDPNAKEKENAAITCKFWFRTLLRQSTISIDDIIDIVIKYLIIGKRLKFSTEYQSEDGLELREDNYVLVREGIPTASYNKYYRWILADMEPVTEGIHCWRVNAKHQKDGGWIVYGVSPRQMFANSCGQDGVWGVTCNGCWYPGGCTTNKISTTHFYRQNLDVDILLNLETGELRICVVGMLSTDKEAVLQGIHEVDNEDGWVLHLNVFNNGDGGRYDTEDTEVRIAEISPEIYGQSVDGLF